MIRLLEFVVMFLSELFDKHGFYIKESRDSGSRFSGASLLLSSGDMEIFLAIERDEKTAYFRSLFDIKENNWYPLDVVLTLLGYADCNGIFDERTSLVIKKELPRIVKFFGKNEFERTLSLLNDIQKKR